MKRLPLARRPVASKLRFCAMADDAVMHAELVLVPAAGAEPPDSLEQALDPPPEADEETVSLSGLSYTEPEGLDKESSEAYEAEFQAALNKWGSRRRLRDSENYTPVERAVIKKLKAKRETKRKKRRQQRQKEVVLKKPARNQ